MTQYHLLYPFAQTSMYVCTVCRQQLPGTDFHGFLFASLFFLFAAGAGTQASYSKQDPTGTDPGSHFQFGFIRSSGWDSSGIDPIANNCTVRRHQRHQQCRDRAGGPISCGWDPSGTDSIPNDDDGIAYGCSLGDFIYFLNNLYSVRSKHAMIQKTHFRNFCHQYSVQSNPVVCVPYMDKRGTY